MRLTDAYESYLLRPSIKNGAILLKAIKSYNFANYTGDMYRMLRLYRDRHRLPIHTVIRSNGSTRVDTEYNFGPHRDWWIHEIESHLWQNNGSPLIYIKDPYPYAPLGYEFQNLDNAMRISLRHPDAIGQLIKLFRDRQPACYRALPSIYLYLCRSDRFLDFLASEGHKYITRFISTDLDAFYDEYKFNQCGFRINDQMINWRSGLNFYTCNAGTRHFLPIFMRANNRYYNFLNLARARGVEIDDFFEVTGPLAMCKCNIPYFPFNFVPHIKNCSMVSGIPFYDLTIARRLIGQYFSCQFYSDANGQLHIYYVAEDGTDDLAIFNSYNAQLHSGRTFVVGSRHKKPTFWSGIMTDFKPVAYL